MQCSALSIIVLHDIPLEERQLELKVLIEQFETILTSLMSKESTTVDTLNKSLAMISKMVKESLKPFDMKKVLVGHGLIDTLLKVLGESHADKLTERRNLIPSVIKQISQLLADCDSANIKMIKIKGYERLFESIESFGQPCEATLKAVLALSTFEMGDDCIRSTEPIIWLLRWMIKSDKSDNKVWLSEALFALCSSSLQNKMLSCESGVLLLAVEALEAHRNLDQKSVIEMLKLIETLGRQSISPYELKRLITLLKENDKEVFPFRSHVIHVISSMAKSDGFDVCRNYFDIDEFTEGLTIPSIRSNSPQLASGFGFHCWVRLDKVKDESAAEKRRQLYSMYTGNGNGLEAFFTSDGILVVSVANKKEFLAVPLNEYPLNDQRWHCVQISHTAGKRPFGASCLCIYIDGSKRLECGAKYPSLNEPFSYCQIGSPLRRSNVPALNVNEARPASFKEGFMDALKVVPGVINLPQSLKSSQNDPHVKWTLIGLEDQLWGKSAPLAGQVGMIAAFQDGFSALQAKFLFKLGPNHGLNLTEDLTHNPEVIDLFSKVAFFYSARASQNMTCPNLNSPSKLEAQILGAKSFVTQDVKDVINCIGGVQALFPLLESAANEEDLDLGKKIKLPH